MKRLFDRIWGVFILLIMLSFSFYYECQAQVHVDPLVAAAIKTSSNQEKEVLNSIKKIQDKVLVAQGLITKAIQEVNKINEKSHQYLTQVSTAISSSRDVIAAGKTAKIILEKRIPEFITAVKENPQGFITTTLSDKIQKDIKADIVRLTATITNIALDKKKLLNPYERLAITSHILEDIRNIEWHLKFYTYQTYALSFKDIPRKLAPDIYYRLVNHKDIADRVINDMKNQR